MILTAKKATVWVLRNHLITAIHLPLDFIRKMVFIICKKIYKRPEWIPLSVIKFCFPVYPIKDSVSRNGLLIPFVMDRLALILYTKAEDFKLYKVWNQLIVRNRLISDHDYDELFRILSSSPDMFFTTILDYCIRHGDIDGSRHQYRVINEARYREHLADIREMLKTAIG